MNATDRATDEPGRGAKRALTGVALVALAFALAAGVLWIQRGSAQSAESADSAAALPVETASVDLVRGYERHEKYAGRVVARRSSDLGFERGGRLESVAVDEGDRVEAGQVLAALDTRQLRARRRELSAQRKVTRARLSLAQVTVERRAKLRESDHISSQLYDEAAFETQALEAQLSADRAALERIDVDLALSELAAPYAGSVTERRMDEGTVVSPGQHILHLIEDGALEVKIGVPPETAARLEPGQRHFISIGERKLPGELEAILGTVDPDTRTVTVIFRLTEAAPEVKNGALARVVLETHVEDTGFWLPITALTESRRGLWSAYAVESESGDPALGNVRRRELEVIHAEADRVFVRGTLREGERVVASGLHRLVPGQRVRVLQ